jgi:hypothetical protein
MSREIRRFAGDDQVYENGNKIGTANLNLTCTGYVARDNSGNSYGTYNDQMDAAKAIPAPGSESGSSSLRKIAKQNRNEKNRQHSRRKSKSTFVLYFFVFVFHCLVLSHDRELSWKSTLFSPTVLIFLFMFCTYHVIYAAFHLMSYVSLRINPVTTWVFAIFSCNIVFASSSFIWLIVLHGLYCRRRRREEEAKRKHDEEMRTASFFTAPHVKLITDYVTHGYALFISCTLWTPSLEMNKVHKPSYTFLLPSRQMTFAHVSQQKNMHSSADVA